MKTNQCALIAGLALALAVLLIASCAGSSPTKDGKSMAKSGSAGKRAHFSPSKLFDFSNFKKLFKKNYASVREELVRKKYFLARAFRAYISSIKYKYRKSTFYLAINDMSDWTPKEIKMSRNEVLSASIKEKLKKLGQRVARKFERSDLPEGLPEDADQAERELRSLVEADAASESGEGLRELPLEKLIELGAGAQLSPEVARKFKRRVASNNPDYEPLDLPSHGLIDQQIDVETFEVNPSSSITRWCSNTFTDAILQARRQRRGHSTQLEDQVFVDLRQSNCFLPVRHQGTCGACYAFAAMAMFEWLYCIETNNMAMFSEQYVIDCGSAFVDGINGCHGGQEYAVGRFVKNFGVELLPSYPYFMQQNQCPYNVRTNLQRTGYLRFDFTDMSEIPINVWPHYLRSVPISVGMAWEPMFHEYRNGVFGWGCDQEDGSHAVLIVGHGREDGHQYWLIRNSHGTSWGDGGYGKLAKEANCINPGVGYVYATEDGEERELNIRLNQHNNPAVVQTFVANLMNG